MCGGTRRQVGGVLGLAGLSPRVRGNPNRASRKASDAGSIPACAGEPPTCGSRGCSTRVYPRVCGGTQNGQASAFIMRGLSPRVRGNRLPGSAGRGGGRSIPACAGEPRNAPQSRLSGGVYPRVCGGTIIAVPSGAPAQGLSPRVRGNPPAIRPALKRGRSIPACAGEPLHLDTPRPPLGVYPRVCGGTVVRQKISQLQSGLSPRVRGNPPNIFINCSCSWSIPACAGEPLPFKFLFYKDICKNSCVREGEGAKQNSPSSFILIVKNLRYLSILTPFCK